MESTVKTVIFYIFSITSVISAVFVIIKRNPVTSAINLVVTFFSISGIYVLLNSQFIAIMQVLVYAGAIMVLILFVIMLLNLRLTEMRLNSRTILKAALTIMAVSFMAASLVTIVYYGQFSGAGGGITSDVIAETGSARIIARAMFSQYLLPFELVSLLITIGITGVVILSRSGLPENKEEGE